ncbi:MAG: ISAs1 family transposase [Thermomicrobiales bacterium]
MAVSPGSTITTHFATLTDPRIDHTKRHHLLDLLTIALCAILCGADEWVAMEQFGNAKREWFATSLTLPNGIPSHDTFGRVFAALDPDQFQHCFLTWVQQSVTQTDGAVIACDGKTVRRSHDRGEGKAAVHMVSAWASAQQLVLGQVAVEEKSNEWT